MKPTNLIQDDFDALTAGADLDTQGGYAKMAGSGTTDFFVIADTQLEGTQSIAIRNAAASQTIGYERTIGSARVAGTTFWRARWLVRINAGATENEDAWVKFSAGAGDVFAGVSGNDAVAIGFRKTGGNVFVSYADNSSIGFQAISAAVGADDTTMALRLEFYEDNTYALVLDADNDGEGWVQIRRGTLVSGREAISRFSFQTNAAASADDTIKFDDITVTLIKDDDEVDLGERPLRYVKITAASVSADGSMLTLTMEILDGTTGATLAAGRAREVPAYYLDPGNEALVQTVLEDELKIYNREQRAADLVGTGRGF